MISGSRLDATINGVCPLAYLVFTSAPASSRDGTFSGSFSIAEISGLSINKGVRIFIPEQLMHPSSMLQTQPSVPSVSLTAHLNFELSASCELGTEFSLTIDDSEKKTRMDQVIMADKTLLDDSFDSVWRRMDKEHRARTKHSYSQMGSKLWGLFGDDVERCIGWLGVYDQIPKLIWETMPPPVLQGGDFRKRCGVIVFALSMALKSR